MVERDGWPGAPGETVTAGVDWALPASSTAEHEDVASTQMETRPRAGRRRVTRGPFLLGGGISPIYQRDAVPQRTFSLVNSDVSDG